MEKKLQPIETKVFPNGSILKIYEKDEEPRPCRNKDENKIHMGENLKEFDIDASYLPNI